jgi:hypothetical protein
MTKVEILVQIVNSLRIRISTEFFMYISVHHHFHDPESGYPFLQFAGIGMGKA